MQTLSSRDKLTVKTCVVLGGVALGYSAVFLLPRALFTPDLARNVIVVLLPLFTVAMFATLRGAGLWQMSGLACDRTVVRGAAQNAVQDTAHDASSDVLPSGVQNIPPDSQRSVPRIITSPAKYATLPCGLMLAIPLVNLLCTQRIENAGFIAACVIVGSAALIEEMCFRGLAMGILQARGVQALTNVGATSVAFAVLHVFNASELGVVLVALQCACAFLLGAAFGFVRLTTGSVYPCLIVHVLINVTAVITPLYNEWQVLIELVIALVACVCSYMCWKRYATKPMQCAATIQR